MKQNFDLDGSSADFIIVKGKVVPDYKISFVIIAKKGLFPSFFGLSKSRGSAKLRAPSVWFFFKTCLAKVELIDCLAYTVVVVSTLVAIGLCKLFCGS